MPPPTERTEYEYVLWSNQSAEERLVDWLNEFGEVGFRLVSHISTDSEGEIYSTAIMERSKVRTYAKVPE